MCIATIIGETPHVVKNGELKLWKVVRKDNVIGLWGETNRGNVNDEAYLLGDNRSHRFVTMFSSPRAGQFHCFFTRKSARCYRKAHQRRATGWAASDLMRFTKIIRVYADSSDVVAVGVDSNTKIPAISVSKMEIKSLKHQR